ncbi:MAG: ABC transporter ATP-binding protein [Egibacteraceae bacterium]
MTDVLAQAPAAGEAVAPPAVRTSALAKTFPSGLVAVDGLDLTVASGEILGLLGPNGAGKTTTIGMLTTRVVPTSGRATIHGLDVATEPSAVKAHIGVVPQTTTLDRSLDVRENLVFHGRYFGLPAREASERADALLERFRLDEKARERPQALSGGMAQRLMVARALLHRPALLFLDEPTTGLDPQSRIALWDLLVELHDEGQTILVTTHHMEEAERLCDRVAIMDHGRLLALGTPADLTASVEGDRVVELSAEGDLEGLARRLRGVAGVRHADARSGGVRVWAAEVDGLLPPLLAAADTVEARVRDVTVSEPSLESVFIALTGRELRD